MKNLITLTILAAAVFLIYRKLRKPKANPSQEVKPTYVPKILATPSGNNLDIGITEQLKHFNYNAPAKC